MIPVLKRNGKAEGEIAWLSGVECGTVHYSRQAQSVVKLFTGGKARPGQQRLFALTGMLQPARYDWALGGGQFVGDGVVPGEATIWGDLGPADADYTAWGALANGQTVDVTPRTGDPTLSLLALAAAGPANHGTVNPVLANLPGLANYELRIKWLNAPSYVTNSDITGQTNSIVAGQTMILNSSLVGLPGSSSPPTLQHLWSVPGFAISNYSADVNLGIVYTNFAITNSVVRFHWVDGGAKRVEVSVFSGTAKLLSTNANFQITRPSASWVGSIDSPVSVDSNYWTEEFGTVEAVHLGSANTDPGATFTYSNPILGAYTNDFLFFCTQVGTSFYRFNRLDGNSVQQAANGLDMTVPYDSFAKNWHSGWTTDSPGKPIFGGAGMTNKVVKANRLKMFLMFQAVGLESIPVPVKYVEWEWTGTAMNSSNAFWYLDPGSTNAIVRSNDASTMEFPVWTNLIQSVPVTTNSWMP